MHQLFLAFLTNGTPRTSCMRLRGLRSINPVCCVLLVTGIVVILITVFINSIIHTYIVYNHFIQSYPFSTVPFWKDNRTTNKKALLPILKVGDVNLSNATIAITACCRNVRKHLDGFQRNIKAITALFGNYHIYLGESDSRDKTLEFLNEWQKNDTDHVRVHTKGRQSRLVSSRTARLASCRNSLLQQAREELSSSFDYYLVVDVDVGSSPSFEIKDFLTNFVYPPSSWIAMTASQRSEYYDIWALRIESILPFDCWERIVELTSSLIDRSFLTERIVQIHQQPIPRNVSLIEVESAFGGAAIYNGKYLNNECLYNGIAKNGWWESTEQCEHVPFHQCLRENAKEQKIYINPQFQIC